ncbi:MAG: TetR/AcrR family transcriptional regulator [Hyphomonadaceae bacterium]
MKAPSENLRDAVMEASVALIEEEGLEALSMREVARRAGVSHQAPYHHFGDREGILAALVEDGFAMLTADMRRALAKTKEPRERFKAMGELYVRFALKHPAHFKLMFRSEMVSPQRHEDTHERAETCFDLFVSVVDELALSLWGRRDEVLPLTAWSLAHGVATLALEGKLDRRVGKSRSVQAAAAKTVIEQFGALLFGERPKRQK